MEQEDCSRPRGFNADEAKKLMTYLTCSVYDNGDSSEDYDDDDYHFVIEKDMVVTDTSDDNASSYDSNINNQAHSDFKCEVSHTNNSANVNLENENRQAVYTNRKKYQGQSSVTQDEDMWQKVDPYSEDHVSTTHSFGCKTENGVRVDLGSNPTPLQCFQSLFTQTFLMHLLDNVNNYASQHCHPRPRLLYAAWEPVSEYELIKFLAVLIQMGINHRPSVKDYWSTNAADYCEWYHQMFSRNRFQAIFYALFNFSKEAAVVDQSKTEPFYNMLISRYKEAFYPFQDVTIDEIVVRCTSQHGCKMLRTSKPKKDHTQVFGLCDSITGYVVNVLIYHDKELLYRRECETNSQHTFKVFDFLLQGLQPGHHIFSSHSFTSYELITFLLNKQFCYTGTVSINAIHFPLELKKLRLHHRQHVWFHNATDDVLCVAWQDDKTEKPIICASTKAEAKMETVQTSQGKLSEKPAVILKHKTCMKGCSRVNQTAEYYDTFNRKSVKCCDKLFPWLLEVTQLNAHVLHTLTNENKMSLLTFKKRLVEELANFATSKAHPDDMRKIGVCRKRSVAVERLQDVKHIISYCGQDRTCRVCSTPQKRVRTHFFCKGCSSKPHLHPNICFEKYHSTEFVEN